MADVVVDLHAVALPPDGVRQGVAQPMRVGQDGERFLPANGLRPGLQPLGLPDAAASTEKEDVQVQS